MPRRLIVSGNGAPTTVELTPDEIAKLDEQRIIDLAAAAVEQQKDVAVAAARPGAAIVQKLKDGTALTAGELQTVVRWLALREAREILS